jgi:hypothetical protein
MASESMTNIKECPIHAGEMMYQYDKNGQTWFSHKTSDPAYANSKGYCNGREPKEAATNSAKGGSATATENYTGKARSIARMNALTNAVNTLKDKPGTTPAMVKELAEAYYEWISQD